MAVACLLDTGVLVYAVSSAPAEAPKKKRALDLIRNEDFGLSGVVLEDFYLTVTTKIRKPLAPDVVVALLDEYRIFPVVPTDYPLIVRAIELSLLHGLAYREAAVLAGARALGAGVVYSDAFGSGGSYDAVRVVNPFTAG